MAKKKKMKKKATKKSRKNDSTKKLETAMGAAAFSASSTGKFATGLVSKLYPTTTGTYIEMDNATPRRPKDDLFFLPVSHGNYNAVYSLVLAASVNRYRILLRTEETITSSIYPNVLYATVEF